MHSLGSVYSQLQNVFVYFGLPDCDNFEFLIDTIPAKNEFAIRTNPYIDNEDS